MRFQRRSRTFGSHLVLAIVAVVGITASALGFISARAFDAITANLIDDRARSSETGTQRRIEDRERAQVVFAQLLAADRTVVDAISTGDSQQIAKALIALKATLDLGELRAFGADGRELIRLSQREGFDGNGLLQAARAGLATSQVSIGAEGLTIESVAPVKDGTGIIGAIVVGVTIDGEQLASLSVDASTPIVLYSASALIDFSAGFGFTGDQVAEAVDPSAGASHVHFGSRSFRQQVYSLGGGDELVLLIPIDSAESANRSRTLAMAVASAAALVVVGLLGALYARRFTTPLRRMVGVAEAIGAGHYDDQVAKSSVSELNALGTTINRLGADVRAKVDLLSYSAAHDPLTGLANRTAFAEQLQRTLADPLATSAAVLLVDIDDFKEINDRLGHQAGDELLVAIAARLRVLVRAGDTVSRIGGDEFAVLLENCGDSSGLARADQIVRGLAEPIELADGVSSAVTVSVGMARETGGPHDDTSLLRDADTAMYAAKVAGKGRYAQFEPQMRAHLIDAIKLKSDLRSALTNDELYLDYQPIFSMPDGALIGNEALVRWSHPRLGLIGPDRFIPIAEQTGLILAIGQWVLEHACAQTARWNCDHPDLGVSVNVSVKQLRQQTFVTNVERALAVSGLTPRHLTLEITESILIGNHGFIAERLAQLDALGVRISLDDFGTGYSSLSYLQQLTFNEIKIDRGFVDTIGDIGRPSLIPTIIDMARALGATTVAEGIETEEQLRTLVALGCDSGQGFLLGRPQRPMARPVERSPLVPDACRPKRTSLGGVLKAEVAGIERAPDDPAAGVLTTLARGPQPPLDAKR